MLKLSHVDQCPCINSTAVWNVDGGNVRTYVTFMGTARTEGERSTAWCPGIGLNFNRTKNGRGRRDGKRISEVERKRRRNRVKINRQAKGQKKKAQE